MASAVLTTLRKRLKLGYSDCGRRLTEKQFLHAEYDAGFHYELIEGRLDVVTQPRHSHDWIERWLRGLLEVYAKEHPEAINCVTPKSVIYVPETTETTRPEPDIAAYHDFPVDLGPDVEWQQVSPVLVVEILSEGGIAKDLVRNVELYALVPTIQEYWVLDGLPNARQPTLTVRRRRGKGWSAPTKFTFGETYTTKLLPGFVLKLQPTTE